MLACFQLIAGIDVGIATRLHVAEVALFDWSLTVIQLSYGLYHFVDA
jgi:hypothetical protein